MEYELTVADVRAYLESLEPDQVCGIPSRPRDCLVAIALEHKYHGSFHVNYLFASYCLTDRHEVKFSDGVKDIVQGFDKLAPIDNPQEVHITRQQAEEAIPELKGTN